MDETFTNDCLWAISKLFAEENYDPVNKIMSELNSKIIDITWNPSSAHLNSSNLSFVLNWWKKNCFENSLPNPSVINPEELTPALGKIAILEPIDNGRDFKYRLYGSKIVPELFKDLTGQYITDIWTPLRTYFLINYRAVLMRRQVLFSVHKPHISLDFKQWKRLILPFGMNGKITRLMIVLISE